MFWWCFLQNMSLFSIFVLRNMQTLLNMTTLCQMCCKNRAAMENLSTHSLHFLLYFEAQVSVAGPPAFACAHLSAHLLRSFMPFDHPLRAGALVIMTARGLHIAVPILCGRPRCGHRACHLAARWPCGLGARALLLQPVLHICFPRLSLFVRCLATVPRRSIYTQFRRLTAEPVMGKR